MQTARYQWVDIGWPGQIESNWRWNFEFADMACTCKNLRLSCPTGIWSTYLLHAAAVFQSPPSYSFSKAPRLLLLTLPDIQLPPTAPAHRSVFDRHRITREPIADFSSIPSFPPDQYSRSPGIPKRSQFYPRRNRVSSSTVCSRPEFGIHKPFRFPKVSGPKPS